MNWYELQTPDALDTPALLVFPERVRANIAETIRMAGGPDRPGVARLRPHTKTHKSPDVARLLLDAGISNFKAATLKEARMLAQAGAADVLLAYPVVGPRAEGLKMLRSDFPNVAFSALTDHPDAARHLNATFADQPLDVFIDVNVGMNRTGLLPAEVPAFYDLLATLPGLRVVGLHAYDGHIGQPDVAEREQSVMDAFAPIWDAQRMIQERTGAALPVVAGGSRTFPIHARLHPQATLSPGTFVFWDAGYWQGIPDYPMQPAAVLITRVVSLLDNETLCVDLGHKAVAAEQPLANRAYFLNVADAVPIGQSEEHLVLRVPNARHYVPGDVFYALPGHICPTVNLYDTLHVIENGEHVADWPITARGH